jgi:hypothetical protein
MQSLRWYKETTQIYGISSCLKTKKFRKIKEESRKQTNEAVPGLAGCGGQCSHAITVSLKGTSTNLIASRYYWL